MIGDCQSLSIPVGDAYRLEGAYLDPSALCRQRPTRLTSKASGSSIALTKIALGRRILIKRKQGSLPSGRQSQSITKELASRPEQLNGEKL